MTEYEEKKMKRFQLINLENAFDYLQERYLFHPSQEMEMTLAVLRNEIDRLQIAVHQ